MRLRGCRARSPISGSLAPHDDSVLRLADAADTIGAARYDTTWLDSCARLAPGVSFNDLQPDDDLLVTAGGRGRYVLRAKADSGRANPSHPPASAACRAHERSERDT